MEVHIWQSEKVQYRINFAFEDDSKQGQPFMGEFLTQWADKSADGEHILTVGLGLHSDFDVKRARRAVAKSVCTVREMNVQKILIDLSVILNRLGGGALECVAESAFLALYRMQNWNFENKVQSKTELFWDGISGINDAKARLEEAAMLAELVCCARDLVNEPSNLLYPHSMAEKMAQMGKEAGLSVTVMDEKQIKDLGMEAFLTVGRDSVHPPRLIVLRYDGDPKSQNRIALVGKGVTCDTGGYCLKPASSMAGIKGDMAGGAAVFGCIVALAKSKAKVNATAVIPACENRIGPGGFIPGDIIGSMSGRKIEIGNTDAEGRLILADAVTYAIRKEHATCVLDIATLTGAVVNMLGFTTAGLLCDNDDFCDAFLNAAEFSGEQYWRLPIYPEYEKMIEGKLADISNVSTDGCGTITAGLFIRTFAEGLPWIHLDIAGTAWVDSPRWEFQSKGATGAGVTTLYHFCRRLGTFS